MLCISKPLCPNSCGFLGCICASFAFFDSSQFCLMLSISMCVLMLRFDLPHRHIGHWSPTQIRFFIFCLHPHNHSILLGLFLGHSSCDAGQTRVCLPHGSWPRFCIHSPVCHNSCSASFPQPSTTTAFPRTGPPCHRPRHPPMPHGQPKTHPPWFRRPDGAGQSQPIRPKPTSWFESSIWSWKRSMRIQTGEIAWVWSRINQTIRDRCCHHHIRDRPPDHRRPWLLSRPPGNLRLRPTSHRTARGHPREASANRWWVWNFIRPA